MTAELNLNESAAGGLRAIMVCVDYADLLSVTLPRNRHHFAEVWVVTSPQDTETRRLAGRYGCGVYTTDAFYRGGADFNKWLALEEGLDEMGRLGWLCLMDADVIWPKELPDIKLYEGYLYSPLRRMCAETDHAKPEQFWQEYPIHPNVREWAGYTQIFHAFDSHLPPVPWHQVDWRHAGGADSYFQALWPHGHKFRPHFEVLHLGPAGQNWCGRATPVIGGERPPEGQRRLARLRGYLQGRRVAPPGTDCYAAERLGHAPVAPEDVV